MSADYALGLGNHAVSPIEPLSPSVRLYDLRLLALFFSPRPRAHNAAPGDVI